MKKQQHSLDYGVYQSWWFYMALYLSKALSSIRFLDALTQVLQHEPVEQKPCILQICQAFCLWNQKQIFQEAARNIC